MHDVLDIEQRGLATAGSTSAVPAPRTRNKLAALVAVIFMAVALMFAMPSLAYASNDAEASNEASVTQEILQTTESSSTSANIKPDDSPTPPGYTPQDAFKSTSELKATEVDLVSGEGASSYTHGDQKGASNSADSDDDSDNASNADELAGIDGIEMADDSIENAAANGDETTSPETDNASTGDSTGASPVVDDELATGNNNQSAQPTVDNNIGVDDVKATEPAQSAVQTVTATSEKEAKAVYGPIPLSASSDNDSEEVTSQIVPQAKSSITIYWNKGFTTTPSGTSTTEWTPDKTFGNPNDPVFKVTGTYNDATGTLIGKMGTPTTVTDDTDAISRGFVKGKIVYYGYYLTQFIFIGKNKSTGKWMKLSADDFAGLNSVTVYKNGTVEDVKCYVNLNEQGASVQFQYCEAAGNALVGGSVNYKAHEQLVFPVHSSDNPDLVWIAEDGRVANGQKASTALDESSATLSDALNSVFNTRAAVSYDASTMSYKMAKLVIRETVKPSAAISYTVTYNNGGGTGDPVTKTYTSASAFATDNGASTGNDPVTFTRAGHTFKGWATTNGATTPNVTPKGSLSGAFGTGTPANNGAYTLYAVWEALKYTITYDQNKPAGVSANAGSMPAAQSNIAHGSSATLSNNTPTLSGYTFAGWATSANGPVAHAKGATIASVTSDMTLYAVWTQWPTITYDGNGHTGGTVPASTTKEPGTTYNIANGVPTRTGYIFAGWTTTQNSTSGTKYSYNGGISGTTGTYTMTNDNVTFFSLWNPTITYNANKPAAETVTSVTGMPTTNPVTVTYGGSATAAAAPELIGWTFGGWTTNSNGTGSNYAAGDTINSVNAPMTLYAKWTVNTGYTVVFYDKQDATSDGTPFNTQSNKSWTDSFSLPASNPEKTGYTFGGWFVTKNGDSATGAQVSASTINQLWNLKHAADLTIDGNTKTLKVYAKWTEKAKVSFTLNPNSGTYNGTTAVYTIANILNGGSASIPATSAISNPTREGYNFRGWTESSAGTGTLYQAGATFNNLTTSKTLYAKWEKAVVTFTFEKGAPASEITALRTPDPYTMTANYGDSITVPSGTSVYTRAAYDFKQWVYTSSSNNTATIPAAGSTLAVSAFKITWTGDSSNGDLAGKVTITADWTAYTYNLQWNLNYGTNILSTTPNLTADSTITVPNPAPTRLGYTFKGWKTASNGTGNTVATGNTLKSTWTLTGLPSGSTVVAYAQWEEDKVVIRVYGDGSKSGVKYGDGSALASGSEIYVGKATGDIYASASATTPTGKNINTTGVKPDITDTSYEFSAAHGSKWTSGSATGTTVATTETLSIGKTGGVYVTGDYYLTVSPKWYNYKIEYYIQNANDNNYTLATSPVGAGTAPYGYALVLGTPAGVNDTTKTVTAIRSDITGYTYNGSAAGTVDSLTSISDVEGNNVLKLYFDRNEWTVKVTYTGTIPPSQPAYTPATETKRYGETVTLTTPTAPTGYKFDGWSLKNTVTGLSNSQINSGSFAMPNADVEIQGTWSKIKYNLRFENSDTSKASVTGTLSYTLDYEDTLNASQIPTVTVSDTNNYYFMGWELFEECSSTSPSSVTGGTSKGIMSTEAILDATNPWKITSHSRFVARFGKTVVVTYDNNGGGFTVVNGSMTSGAVTQPGTYYTQLQLTWNLPKYGGAFDAVGDRNENNPKATPGYKFVGWQWVDAIDANITKTAYGYYNAAGTFVKTSGNDMPAQIDQSYTFKALWEKTTQLLLFVNDTTVNGVNITGATASEQTAKIDEQVTLPKAPGYAATTNATSYTFVGWTTDIAYVAGTSPLYTDTFTMTAGTRNTTLYSRPNVDYGYGVTLYPVFTENYVTILYKFCTGSESMGTLSLTTEGNTLRAITGTVNGSTATANTGYKFMGWYKDASHTTAVDTAWVTGNKLTPQKEPDAYKAATYFAYFMAEDYTINFMVGDNATWTDGTAVTDPKSVTLSYNTQYGSNVPTYNGTTPAMKANTGYGFKEWAEINPTSGATIRTLSDASLRGERVTADRIFVAIWEPRSGYTIVYNTVGGTPAFANTSTTFTAVLDTVIPAATKTGPTKQGYTFGGWYTKSDYSDAGISGNTTITFEQACTMAGITPSGDDPISLELFAKWDEKSFTLKYAPSWPGTTTTTFSDITVTWTQDNLLPVGYDTLTELGFDFKNWNTKSNAAGLAVTNSTTFADIYRNLYGNTDNSKTEATIYGCWGQRSFTVQFKTEAGVTVKTHNNVTFNDTIPYYSYAPTDGSKTLLGWKYTPAGGTEQQWLAADSGTNLPVSVFDGTPSPEDNSVFVLTAIMQSNATYQINYYTVNVDGNGDPIMAQATRIKQESGYAPINTAINIKDGTFNGIDYVTRFETNNGAGRRADLKGYVLQNIPGQTKISADASEVTVAGSPVVFNVYFVEKIFTIEYDLGADVLGNPCPVTVGVPAPKNASYNSSNLEPTVAAGWGWEGYKAPKWQYKNSTGTWVTLPTNAKVKDIITTDDNSVPITLKALWESDVVRLIFNAQTGGSIRGNADGTTFTVGQNSSKNIDIDAVNGPAPTATATAGTGYIFEGWYKDGVLVTHDATFTVAADLTSGLYTSATYEARFRALGSIDYDIKHFYEDADGNYVEDTTKLETRGGTENATINVSNDMIKNVKGYTYTTGISGEKLSIAQLVAGEELRLYYRLNQHDVWVTIAETGADCPVPTPTPVYAATGITQSHTTQKYGTALTLPTVTVPDGWSFEWTVKYRETGDTADTTQKLASGAAFTMVDGDVNVIGTWKRLTHTVNFVAGTGAHGSVTAKAPATLPFTVNHGKNLNDASATGNSNSLQITPDATWALVSWSYVDENGQTLTTEDPDNVIINIDTVFTAIWAQTYTVSYSPGSGVDNHGGIIGSDDFTKLVVVDRDIKPSDNKNVNTLPLIINGTNYDNNPPAADGYNFIGWTWTRGGNTYYELATTPSASFNLAAYGTAGTRNWVIDENVTFTAMWEAAEHTLKFFLGGGTPKPAWTSTGVAAGTAGDIYTATPNPRTAENVTLLGTGDITRDGHTLSGWRQWNDANGNGTVEPSELVGSVIAAGGTFQMPAHDVTFIPMWEFDTLKIRYEIETGSTGRGTLSSFEDTITNAGASQLTGSKATANAGYRFDGWYTDAACTTKVPDAWITASTNWATDPSSLQTATIQPIRPAAGWVTATYYAKFVAGKAEYTIEYYLQDADGNYQLATITPNKFADIDSDQMADVTDTTNAAYTHLLDTDGAYNGYKFNNAAYGQILTAQVKADGTTVLKVYYDLLWYDITYDLGTNEAGDAGYWATVAGPAKATGTSTVTIPEAKLNGMSLVGWTITWTDNGGTPHSEDHGSSFTMPFYNVVATAKWAKNIDFRVVVYEGAWNGTTLEPTNRVIGSNWPNPFTAGDGTATITINGSTVTVSAPNTQGSSFFPKSYTMPNYPGFEYIAAACDPIGIYDTDAAPVEDGLKIMKIYLAPKTGYTVHYVVLIDGAEIATKSVVWGTDNLNDVTLPATYAGYELYDTGWQYKSAGDYEDVDATMTYGDIVNAIYGMPRDSVKDITLYAKVRELTYQVIFVDDTNGTDAVATVIADPNGFTWTAPVTMSDPATFTPSYDKPNYKWMGWEVRRADGTVVSYVAGDAPAYSTLANHLGLSADAAMLTPVTVYAVWAEYLPVTIEFYTKDSAGETKFDEVTYPASDMLLYDGSTYTVPEALITAKRPNGFTFDSGDSILSLVGDATRTNVLKVVYSEYNSYKLFLNINYGTMANAQTITGLTWNSQPASKATAEPTRIGWRLDNMPHRWNTKKDGTGHDFDADATYADIASWIHGAAIDDAAILRDGLTLYAQWVYATGFEVIYDLNNNRADNPKIKTDVPDYRNPLDMSALNDSNVAWNTTGFDKSDDTELDAAPHGYIFAGWNTSADGTGLWITNDMMYGSISNYLSPSAELASITFYAQWVELEVVIKYTVDNAAAGYIDRVIDNITAVSGEWTANGSSAGDKLKSVARAYPGWHFVRWELVIDGEPAIALASLTPAGGVTNDITFEGDNSNTIVVHPDSATGRLYGAEYRAIFEKNAPAPIEYDPNGGEGNIDRTEAPFGAHIQLSNGKPFTRDHYVITGWNTDPDLNGTHYALSQADLVLPEDGLKLYAEWTKAHYKVQITEPGKGGTVVPGETDVTYEDPIPGEFVDSTNPQPKPGWHFVGWKYKVTDPVTGEVTEGTTDDLKKITVDGDIEATPIFEGADIVPEDKDPEPTPEPEPTTPDPTPAVTEPEPTTDEPSTDEPAVDEPKVDEPVAEETKDEAPVEKTEAPVTSSPKTGDSNGMGMMILAFWLAIAALVLAIIARRRLGNDDDPEPKAQGTRNGRETFTAAAQATTMVSIRSGACTLVLVLSLALFGVGAILAPSASFADDLVDTDGVIAIVETDDDDAAADEAVEATADELEAPVVDSEAPVTAPEPTEAAVAPADAVETEQNASAGSDEPTAPVVADEPEAAAEAPAKDADDAKDACKADEAQNKDVNTPADENSAADAKDSAAKPENSKNSCPADENSEKNSSDSKNFEAPAMPAEGQDTDLDADLSGTAQVTQIVPFISNDSTFASIASVDLDGPPNLILANSSPLPSNGIFYIRWEKYQTYWMGKENNNLYVAVNPQTTTGFEWTITHMLTAAYDNVFTLSNGTQYLARDPEYPTNHNVILTNTIDANAYWRLYGFENSKGQTAYYLFDMDEVNALTFTLDADWYVDGFICNSNGADVTSLGALYGFLFDKALPQDWTIKYEGNGAIDGTTLKTTVTVTAGGTIAENGYIRPGYAFTGWNTDADGDGTAYAVGQHIAGGSIMASGFVMTLYAQWSEINFDISYSISGNGELKLSDGQTGSSFCQIASSATGMIAGSNNKPIQGVEAVASAGYRFDSWSISGGVGTISDSIKYNSKLTPQQVRALSEVIDEETGQTIYKSVNLTANFVPIPVEPKPDPEPENPADKPGTDSGNTGNNGNAGNTGNTGDAENGATAGNTGDTGNTNNGSNSSNSSSSNSSTNASTKPSKPAAATSTKKPAASKPAASSSTGSTATSTGTVTEYVPASYFSSNDGVKLPFMAPAVAEAAEVAEAADAKSLNNVPSADIQTVAPRDNGPFGAIGQFFSNGTGRIVGIICLVGLAIALIACIAGLVMHFTGAGAGAAASGEAKESRKNSNQK